MKCILYIVVFTISSWGYAQIFNIENFVIAKDTIGFSGGIDINISLVKNTKTNFSFNNYAYVEYRKHKHLLTLTSHIHIKRVDHEDDINNNSLLLKYDYQARKHLFLESFVQNYTNQVTKIDNRIMVGSGARFQFVESKKFMYSFGSYLMYVYEHEDDNNDDDDHDGDLPTINHHDFRLGLYLSAVYDFKENISFKLATFYQPEITYIKDYRFDLMGRASIKILKNLDFNISYILNLDSNPAKDIPTTQYQLLNGLSYTFK
ncbi:DUF481 domain-containing protein [Tamlana agarivorans]|uniref:DUF481 domain-containing protein n=1 Tax=Pseudotamlana agarivorans TaxID=481183 RepID=A0ACC5U4M9_9FLAO|nr:DUF481 domain-containing protein [Tamlana agarivorans]MBU2949266.1 DUF481 domain-containing protein [Tamlana agarivorans]